MIFLLFLRDPHDSIRRNYENARIKIFLSDGAPYNWDIRVKFFSDATAILDWYLASGHFASNAKLVFGESTSAVREWLDKAQSVLSEGDFL